jgi:triacylglycerol lipase
MPLPLNTQLPTSFMLAKLQQSLVFGLAALALIWAVASWQVGRPALALVGAATVLLGYALVLAVEFVLLRLAHDKDSTPLPTPLQILKAWWGEVCCAPLVFAWRQPFRSALFPDHLPADAKGRRGLLLVHGFVCNRGLWNAWLAQLTAQNLPFVAVSLEPVFGSIDDYARTIEAAVKQLEDCTGCAPVIVAHSMGGLAVRRWWADQPNNARVFRFVSIGTPHHGTWLARFAFSTNGAQMRRHSRWLQSLARVEPTDRAALCTCFYGHCDNIVFPPSTGTLQGADNRHLPGVAHVHMVDQPQPWQETLRWLQAPAEQAA